MLYRRVIFGELEHDDLKSISDLTWRESGYFRASGDPGALDGHIPGLVPGWHSACCGGGALKSASLHSIQPARHWRSGSFPARFPALIGGR